MEESPSAPRSRGLRLSIQINTVKRYAIADNAGNVPVKHAGRQGMQRELAVIVYNCVSRIRSSLKTHHDIRFFRQGKRRTHKNIDLKWVLLYNVKVRNRSRFFTTGSLCV